jgi:peptide/nickel transport system permease protein
MGIIAILGATVIVFVLSRVGGQDPRFFYLGNNPGYAVTEEQWDAWGVKLGLDKPVLVQYFLWVGGVVRGDLGNSTTSGRTVVSLIAERAPATGELALGGWIFGTLVGIPLGVLSAVRRGGVLDYLARGFALIGQATPIFWLAIMAILVFSVHLGWFPAGTRGEGLAWRHLIMPWILLGINPAASYLRFTRSSMLEVLDSEYVKLARAKGVNNRRIIWKHALKNASLVPLTVSALVLVGFITGTVVTETVFSWPGLGRMAVAAIWDTDFPVLTGLTMLFALAYVVIILVLDLVYVFIDPRIRLGGTE